jgi:hypothetical protein
MSLAVRIQEHADRGGVDPWTLGEINDKFCGMPLQRLREGRVEPGHRAEVQLLTHHHLDNRYAAVGRVFRHPGYHLSVDSSQRRQRTWRQPPETMTIW